MAIYEYFIKALSAPSRSNDGTRRRLLRNHSKATVFQLPSPIRTFRGILISSLYLNSL